MCSDYNLVNYYHLSLLYEISRGVSVDITVQFNITYDISQQPVLQHNVLYISVDYKTLDMMYEILHLVNNNKTIMINFITLVNNLVSIMTYTIIMTCVDYMSL